MGWSLLGENLCGRLYGLYLFQVGFGQCAGCAS